MFTRYCLLSCCFGWSIASVAMADEPRKSISVATWNVEWLFDDYQGDNFSKLAKEQSAPSREVWEWRRDALAEAIASNFFCVVW